MKTIYLFLISFLLTIQTHAAELFVKINHQHKMQASILDQVQTNNMNTFRFFDLPEGNFDLKVVFAKNKSMFYYQPVMLVYNQRIIAEIDRFGVFKVVQIVTIHPTNWYETIVYGGTINPYPNNPYGYGNQQGVDQGTHQSFLQLMKKESMDANRLKMANDYAKKNRLTAQQITEITALFSFDASKLEFAKNAYAMCRDQGNYFLLKEVFSFSSSYNELLEYIN